MHRVTVLLAVCIQLHADCFARELYMQASIDKLAVNKEVDIVDNLIACLISSSLTALPVHKSDPDVTAFGMTGRRAQPLPQAGKPPRSTCSDVATHIPGCRQPLPRTARPPVIYSALSNDKETVSYPSFAGKWQMDLKASDSLQDVLSALGLNFLLIKIINRLGVTQEIKQSKQELDVTVKTIKGTDAFSLPFDGTITEVPGPTGGNTAQTSCWTSLRLEDGESTDRLVLQTRQAVTGTLESGDAVIFQTLRYILDNGATLCEDVRVLKGGLRVARARRLLRRM